MARIATVHILIRRRTDAEACDFFSETLSDMPYVTDWAHENIPFDTLGDYTIPYESRDDARRYAEGEFLSALTEGR